MLVLECWEVGEAWEAGDDWQMTYRSARLGREQQPIMIVISRRGKYWGLERTTCAENRASTSWPSKQINICFTHMNCSLPHIAYPYMSSHCTICS